MLLLGRLANTPNVLMGIPHECIMHLLMSQCIIPSSMHHAAGDDALAMMHLLMSQHA